MPPRLRPTYVLTLRPTHGRNAIHELRALLKTAWRRHGLRAITVRELPADNKRVKRSPKFVLKTNEPPALSRRMICNRKDSQMKKDDVFPSKNLKHTDLQKPTVATIENAALETLKSREGKTQDKVVLYFEGAKKSLPLNVTNFDAVADICGADTDDWAGCRIELYPSKTQMAGKTVDCLRIRPPAKKAVAVKAAEPEPEDGEFSETENPAPSDADSEIPF
jgi:hypothetical protein